MKTDLSTIISFCAFLISSFALLISYLTYRRNSPNISSELIKTMLLHPKDENSQDPDFLVTTIEVKNLGGSSSAIQKIKLIADTPNGSIEAFNIEDKLSISEKYTMPIQISPNSSKKLSIRWGNLLEGPAEDSGHRWRVIKDINHFNLTIFLLHGRIKKHSFTPADCIKLSIEDYKKTDFSHMKK